MLNRYEEASACTIVTFLAQCVVTGLENWLRGRDLNPRPLGYEPGRNKQRETAGGDQAHIHWSNRGRGATPDHPKLRQIVPVLSPRIEIDPKVGALTQRSHVPVLSPAIHASRRGGVYA
jgi:hypothetical protein